MHHVFTHLSGVPSERGKFENKADALTLQKELHAQGWYYVPVWTTERATAEKYLPRYGSN